MKSELWAWFELWIRWVGFGQPCGAAACVWAAVVWTWNVVFLKSQIGYAVQIATCRFRKKLNLKHKIQFWNEFKTISILNYIDIPVVKSKISKLHRFEKIWKLMKSSGCKMHFVKKKNAKSSICLLLCLVTCNCLEWCKWHKSHQNLGIIWII